MARARAEARVRVRVRVRVCTAEVAYIVAIEGVPVIIDPFAAKNAESTKKSRIRFTMPPVIIALLL